MSYLSSLSYCIFTRFVLNSECYSMLTFNLFGILPVSWYSSSILLQIASQRGRVLPLVPFVSYSRIVLLIYQSSAHCPLCTVWGQRGQFWDTITHLQTRKCTPPYHTKPSPTYKPVNVNGSLLGGVFWRHQPTAENNRFHSLPFLVIITDIPAWCVVFLHSWIGVLVFVILWPRSILNRFCLLSSPTKKFCKIWSDIQTQTMHWQLYFDLKFCYTLAFKMASLNCVALCESIAIFGRYCLGVINPPPQPQPTTVT